MANEKFALLQQINDLGPIEQKVWPESTVFLDWFNENSADVWKAGLGDLYEKLKYDGLWLDMNEVTGFCNGDSTSTDDQCTHFHMGQRRQAQAASQKEQSAYQKFHRFLEPSEPVYNETWYTSYAEK